MLLIMTIIYIYINYKNYIPWYNCFINHFSYRDQYFQLKNTYRILQRYINPSEKNFNAPTNQSDHFYNSNHSEYKFHSTLSIQHGKLIKIIVIATCSLFNPLEHRSVHNREILSRFYRKHRMSIHFNKFYTPLHLHYSTIFYIKYVKKKNLHVCLSYL